MRYPLDVPTTERRVATPLHRNAARILWLALLLTLLALPSQWLPAGIAQSAVGTAETSYVTPKDFDFKALLGDYPADDSAQHKQEVDLMLSLQASRTPEEEKRCQAEVNVTVFAFSDVLGPWFNAKDLPVTANVMNETFDEGKLVTAAAKRLWKRVRPPLADPRIHPCVELENTGSYPSGHAERGMVWAILLADMFPEHKDALLARGKQIGDDRFLAGMHYPSDVVAGQKLGTEIAKKLLANAAFRAQLDQAKAEYLADAAAHHRN